MSKYYYSPSGYLCNKSDDKYVTIEQVEKLESEKEIILELLRPKQERGCDCAACDCGNQSDAERVAAWDRQNNLFKQATSAALMRG